jgi:hypothetical protein
VVGNHTESGTLSSAHGARWNEKPGSGVQEDVQEMFDRELDDYLDRELAAHADPGVKPARDEEVSAEHASVHALAVEEEQWLRTLPPPVSAPENPSELEVGELQLPEHLKPVPAVAAAPAMPPSEEEARWAALPAPLPGLAPVPNLAQPGWNLPKVAGPRPGQWVLAGALLGASAVGLLAVGVLWSMRDSLPSRAQLVAAYAPAGTVSVVPPPLVASQEETIRFVKDSPLVRQPELLPVSWNQPVEGPESALPGPMVKGRVASPPEPPAASPKPVQVAVVQAAPAPEKPAEVATETRKPIQARKALPVQERKAEREVKEWYLKDTQDEAPLMQAPAIARAPAPPVKAAPPPPETKEYDELDKDFAQKLGFTGTAKPAPDPRSLQSVWIPPEPGEGSVERLTPEDIQKVVATHQPAVASCIQQHKEAIPGLKGGQFTMRWFVDPSGSTSGVAMETRALRGTAMASCIEDAVKGWKFPRSQTQLGPIRFPFVF